MKKFHVTATESRGVFFEVEAESLEALQEKINSGWLPDEVNYDDYVDFEFSNAIDLETEAMYEI